ncbi:UNVERIFIED_CONTAM: hypothetical protein K2H54_066624 [Gekko kuhli]
MADNDIREVPVTSGEEVPITTGTIITMMVTSGGVDIFSQYDCAYPVESGQDYGRYGGGDEEQLECIKSQLQAQQEEMWREMQEMMLNLPRLIATVVQHELWLQHPAKPAAPPVGQVPPVPTPPGLQPAPAGVAALAGPPGQQPVRPTVPPALGPKQP